MIAVVAVVVRMAQFKVHLRPPSWRLREFV
jgi:hypothetical protein